MKLFTRTLAVSAALLLVFSATAQLQTKTDEDYDKLMKGVQANFGLARKSADTPEGHKAALALVAAFKDAEEFWAGRKVTQAAEWSKQAMGHAQALEKAIAAKDAAAGAEAGKLLGGTCQTCHTQYREKTAEGGFRIKAQ